MSTKRWCCRCELEHESYSWHGFGDPLKWECSKWYRVEPIEVIPEYIRTERETYAGDTLQAYRGGELSREYVNLHPKQISGMIKKGILTKDQVKKSKMVWKDVKGNKGDKNI